MPQTPEGPDPKSDHYEAPEVEEIPTDGPVSTAPDGTVTAYPSVTLIDEDEDPAAGEQARERDG
jgi:hypothetical protein